MMKVYVVEVSLLVGGFVPLADGTAYRDRSAAVDACNIRSRQFPFATYRVRPYLRVEPAPRKKARSGKGKRRG